jgi:hypothetical protein
MNAVAEIETGDLLRAAVDYYLNLVREARYRTTIKEPDSLPKPDPYARANLIFAGRGRKIIASKLDRIRLADFLEGGSRPGHSDHN